VGRQEREDVIPLGYGWGGGTDHVLMLGLADGNSVGQVSTVVDILSGGMLVIEVRYVLAISSATVDPECTHEFSPVSIISKQPGTMLLMWN
jgi:hypothetical protein